MPFMKKSLVPGVLMMLSIAAFSQSNRELAQGLKAQIEKTHYSPRAIDDNFSSMMFEKIINHLDPRHLVFTQEDYKTLSAYRHQLDEEVNGGSWQFLDLVSGLYRQKLKKADSMVVSILQKPFDFTVAETIRFSNENRFHFATNDADLRNRWSKWFKLQMLTSLSDLQQADSTSPSLKVLLQKNEVSIRDKIRKTNQRFLQSLQDPLVYDSYLKDVYLNALTTTFDPHTMYFSPQDKEDYQSELSTEQFSFGFEVDETNDGKIIIAHLIPGGPAWKSGELHTNDELLQLKWEGREPRDISTLTYDEVDEVLNEPNKGLLMVKVRKKNGLLVSVSLKKEKIETGEDVVKGFILEGPKKIGYISLPDFYTTWEDGQGSGCANDLAKEIIRLKKEKIEGLILDVRYNGGGSLEEALQLAGVFIDEGALTGTKNKSGKLVYLKDPNRGTAFDGPLVLLVNGQSASASELLAAVLQDYNRGVVVGSPTFGKATMQQIFPLESHPGQGFVKITTGKLYRVSGSTAQLKGVIPDIHLPDAFEASQYGERFLEHALTPDSVKRNAYYKPLAELSLALLRQKSSERIIMNRHFKEVTASVADTSASMIPLQLQAYEKWLAKQKGPVVSEPAASNLFKAQNHKDGTQQALSDEYTRSISDVTLKNIQQDIYIEEAYQIMIDLINMHTKN